MKKLIPCLLLLLGLSTAHADSVADIVDRLDREKVAALTAYLEANPKAADRSTALAHLIGAHSALGNSNKIAALLEERYESVAKDADANLGELFGDVVQPLITAYREQGEKDKALDFIDRVGKDTAAHPMANQIEQFLGQLRGELAKPSVGDTLDIAFTDLDDKQVDLAAMKGKVILVDFWATWCGPCVSEMPNVIAAYDKYHGEGFEVIGISLDQDKESLADFIEVNKMPWPQYFDGKGWQNDLAGQFGISSIPATFLIGKDGKVAASDLRGEALESKLAELLKQ